MTLERHDNTGLPVKNILDTEKPHRRQRILKLARNIVIGIAIVLFIGLVRTFVIRWMDGKTLEERAVENNVMHVQVIHTSDAGADMQLTMPGTVESYNETLLYSRINGYVKKWFKDIGEHVKKGEVIAIIDTPEVAKDVEQAKATYNLTKTAYQRWNNLRREDAVSQQELDEKLSAYRQAEAALQRATELLGFSKIVAPFDGIISRRNVNVGDLVNSGNSGVPQAMFGLSQTKQLHVYTYIPQDRANEVKVGQSVDVYQPQAKNKISKGKVVRTAGAIDINTRTLQVDVEILEEKNPLLPGTYVEVAMPMVDPGKIIIPTKTLLFGAAGTQVAVVKDNKVERRAVNIGIDYGQNVEVISGLDPQEQLIMNPRDSITTGQVVVIETPKSLTSGNAK